MTVIKKNLHNLIDSINDDLLLENIYSLLSNKLSSQNLWEKLTEEQKREILDSNAEINHVSKWVSNEEMKLHNKKWLE